MLTAGHCVYNNMEQVVSPGDLSVYIGDHDILDKNKFIVPVKKIDVHFAYDRST